MLWFKTSAGEAQQAHVTHACSGMMDLHKTENIRTQLGGIRNWFVLKVTAYGHIEWIDRESRGDAPAEQVFLCHLHTRCCERCTVESLHYYAIIWQSLLSAISN